MMACSQRFCPLHKITLILAVAALIGVGRNLFLPNSIPWTQKWSDIAVSRALEEGLTVFSLEETRNAVESGSHFLFDARATEEYDLGHIPTAMSLPIKDFDIVFDQFSAMLTPDFPVLVYCSGKECDESIDLAVRLRDLGHTNLVVYTGGYIEWSAAEVVE